MPTAIYSHAEIVERLHKAHAIADRVRASIMRRANQASRDAGLGDIGCQLHNCFIGEPWREVNYSKARLAKRLIAKSWEPSRIIDAYYRRMIGLPPIART